MSDYNAIFQQNLYNLSPDQQNLLLAALSSNNPQKNPVPKDEPDSTPAQPPSGSFTMSPGFNHSRSQSGGLGFADDESPYLDFNPDLDFDFQGTEDLIGDLPGSVPSDDHELGEKRKDLEDRSDNENEESGKKRRESDDKTAKKPGRKPLTSEPTSKRKAQNRAAQRAFRERKEKHLKDLETKVDELQKVSDNANSENGLLRAQVERLQVELRAYRKRLSWVTSGNGMSAVNAIPGAHSRGLYGLNNNDFMFDFPKFGDLPGSHIFNNPQLSNQNQNKTQESQSPATRGDSNVPGVLNRGPNNSPRNNGLSALKTNSSATPTSSTQGTPNTLRSPAASKTLFNRHTTSMNDASNSDSPSSSSDSHQSQLLSSSGTSPEPTTYSPANKAHEHHHTCTYNSIDGEESFCAQLGMACGNISNPIPAVRHNSESVSNTPGQAGGSEQTEPTPNFDFVAQQNGGHFDPVLFGDWREPQDAILGQDFGTFFDDAFPLPDLGSPSHNISEVSGQQAPKKDLIAQIDSKLDEEVVPGEDKAQMLSCTKIWDRLQSMEKFRNGEIDVDNLCSELRTKARCSEGGVVVNQKDVEDIMGRAN
ncbi:DNA-binding transcription factor yap1 [Aspergillus nanangensis]|uniref:AP-1-like transcription factor YAP1 n=1 Tax=Aspergillus nanangensis TaxID=2582783 RepID=A0AAD4CIB3_ASPNN|nr:DNA-binding transcription factor yap1 [Aspergillus nanangensis]